MNEAGDASIIQAIAIAKMIVQHWEKHGQTQVSMNYNGDEPGEVVVARALLKLEQAMKDWQQNS